MKQSRFKILVLVIAIVAIASVGAVLAHFAKSQSLDNKLDMSKPKVYLKEKFNPKDPWVVGEEKEKQVKFGNEGSMDTVLRVRFVKKLTLEDGTEISDPPVLAGFQLNFHDSFALLWKKDVDDWYYYSKVLRPDEITDLTLSSVTLSKQIGNDTRSGKKDYSGALFQVEVEAEMLQASFAKDAATEHGWGMSPSVNGTQVSWQ